MGASGSLWEPPDDDEHHPRPGLARKVKKTRVEGPGRGRAALQSIRAELC